LRRGHEALHSAHVRRRAGRPPSRDEAAARSCVHPESRRGLRRATDCMSENFEDCIGCGLCILGCPAYEETGFDVLTARGRNKALQAGLVASEMVESIWACTLCGYCDAICPSGVHNVDI